MTDVTEVLQKLRELNEMEDAAEYVLITNGNRASIENAKNVRIANGYEIHQVYLDEDDMGETLSEINRMLYIHKRLIEDRAITIDEVNGEGIFFSDGLAITCNHCPDCCEDNYADWEQVDDAAREHTFIGKISFERACGGFRFGDSLRMFYVPCYSVQNGYYSTDVDIYFGGKHVLNTECEEIYE